MSIFQVVQRWLPGLCALVLFHPVYGDTPIARIMAAALTYKEHIEETGEEVDTETPVLFEKALQTVLLPQAPRTVKFPTEAEVYEKLEELEPGISAELEERFRKLPLLLDYEAELGIVFQREVSLAEVEAASSRTLQDTLALFAANDLSLRTFQILGEKSPDKMEFWSAGKSFEGFLPMSAPLAVRDFSLDRWPELRVQCHVDGELRQDQSLSDILYTPRQFFIALAKHYDGRIPAHTALLTGTPAGVAFRMSRLKRLAADFLGLSPFTKLRIANWDSKLSDLYLEPGSQVSVSIQGVGSAGVTIQK